MPPVSDAITRAHCTKIASISFAAISITRYSTRVCSGHLGWALELEFAALCLKMQATIRPVSTPLLPPGYREISSLSSSSSSFSGKQIARVASLTSQARPTFVQRRRQPRCAADYYKTLGVSRTATKQDIKSSYRRLARKVRRGSRVIRNSRHCG